MTPEELQQIALKFGGVSESVRRMNLGTGDRADSTTTKPAQQPHAIDPRSDHVHTLRTPTGPVSFDSQVSSTEENLNKTEKEFLARLNAGVYGRFKWIGQHESIRLELAHKCTLSPDFPVLSEAGEFFFFEVKGGFIREDAWIKLKSAARVYHWWGFVLAQKKDGIWTQKQVER
jgi:hypothetical protein